MKKLLNTAFLYAILGLAGGVFYREFTKLNGVAGGTSLAFLHLHLLVMGMFFFLVAALLEGNLHFMADRRFPIFFTIYHVGMALTIGTFLWRGILQVLGSAISDGINGAISGIAGIGHILVGTGLILFFLMVRKAAAKREKD